MRPLCTWLPVLPLAAGLAAVCCVGDGSVDGPAFYLGGIQVNEADTGAWLAALEDAGMNTVAVTDYARHGEWDSDDLVWEPNDRVVAEIRAAKKRRLAVVLILRLHLDEAAAKNRFLWHGMIRPRGELLDSWFERYGEFARHWAEVAERHGVDALFIGSELNALASTLPLGEIPQLEEYFLNPEKQARRKEELLRHQQTVGDPDLEAAIDQRIANERAWARGVAGGADGRASLAAMNRRRRDLEERWIALIADLRRVYGGRLGYAANFDQYRDVGFWRHLDLMGINAYFPLRDRLLSPARSGELGELLTAGWRRALGEIEEFRRAQGTSDLPVVFTEMGYTYRRHSTLEPWADEGFSVIKYDGREDLVVWRDEPPAPEERALAVRGLWQAHRELERPLLDGILYWKLSTVASHRQVESFVLVLGEPREDPLLAELRRFLTPPAAEPPAADR